MRLAIVMSLVVLATATPSSGQAAAPIPVPFATNCASTSAGTMPSNSQMVIEVLKGSQARDHLAQMKRDHPERFKGVGDALREHGAHPTNEVFVERTRHFQLATSQAATSASCLPSSNDLQPRSDSFSDADGEVIFTSWNDGDDATWEGTIYSEDYSTGNWQTWERQGNISTPNYFGVWGYVDGAGGPVVAAVVRCPRMKGASYPRASGAITGPAWEWVPTPVLSYAFTQPNFGRYASVAAEPATSSAAQSTSGTSDRQSTHA